ncbi:hypothetical protein ABW636_14935 [Aquimarina sp. 2201CG1-2-11]|uniref:TapB family protein n=1 Tax=Aquimarina discodermiae TaxID=3231043 RepID=UPI003462FBB5
MKKILFILSVLLFQITSAQNCEAISPYQQGMLLEYTDYNKKGKVKSIEEYTIESVKNEDGALKIKIKTEVKKGKNSQARYQTLKCVDGNFYIDMSNYMAHQNQNQNSGTEIKAVGDFLEFPSDLAEGTILPDGAIEIQMGNSEASLALANMTVSNRKVLENSSLTTKAGTFEGYKIAFDYLFTMGFIKFRGSGVEWYVKGIGIVKTESYNKKGALRWTRELTKMSK